MSLTRLLGPLAAIPVVLAAILSGTTPAASAATGPCGSLSGAPTGYAHVVVVMDENLSYAAFQATSKAPYLHGLRDACGSEGAMRAATHPSQPNYMAATSGAATLLGRHTGNDNIFAQAEQAGDTWRSYEEGMSGSCSANGQHYKPGHNPAFYYTDLASTCADFDVPLSPALDADIAGDSLPTFAWITPNLCNDVHYEAGCPAGGRIAAGDNWLKNLIPRLTAMPSYVAGRTLIVVTFDEGNGPATSGIDCTVAAEASCRIATIVISPYIAPGAVDASAQSLYSLLATSEDILGYPRLNRAVGRPSMRSGLGF